MTYTIKQLADLAKVSTRTLRYYDEIGLLSPASIGQNGYRYYDWDSLMRLQQILFFRTLDVPLKEIQEIMNQDGFDLQDALKRHRDALLLRSARLKTLIHTIDRTLETLKGDNTMTDLDVFEGFDETKYEDEARERWGQETSFMESTQRWNSYSKAQKDALKQQGDDLMKQLVGTDAQSRPGDADVQAAVAGYHAFINHNFYTCPAEMLSGLAEIWVEDARFAATFNHLRPGGAEFARQAVQIYYDNQSADS